MVRVRQVVSPPHVAWTLDPGAIGVGARGWGSGLESGLDVAVAVETAGPRGVFWSLNRNRGAIVSGHGVMRGRSGHGQQQLQAATTTIAAESTARAAPRKNDCRT